MIITLLKLIKVDALIKIIDIVGKFDRNEN